jgi:glutaredoxin|tara:strand:+ start:61 stop:288 length:228 start_codon:yes stop_codon:yes gene_type:complete
MIEIWSKPQCPFCDKAENLCKQKNFQYKKYMLDVDFSREDMIDRFPSARTFPQITINGELIGGYTEFEAKVNSEE